MLFSAVSCKLSWSSIRGTNPKQSELLIFNDYMTVFHFMQHVIGRWRCLAFFFFLSLIFLWSFSTWNSLTFMAETSEKASELRDWSTASLPFSQNRPAGCLFAQSIKSSGKPVQDIKVHLLAFLSDIVIFFCCCCLLPLFPNFIGWKISRALRDSHELLHWSPIPVLNSTK